MSYVYKKMVQDTASVHIEPPLSELLPGGSLYLLYPSGSTNTRTFLLHRQLFSKHEVSLIRTFSFLTISAAHIVPRRFMILL